MRFWEVSVKGQDFGLEFLREGMAQILGVGKDGGSAADEIVVAPDCHCARLCDSCEKIVVDNAGELRSHDILIAQKLFEEGEDLV